MKKNIQIKPEPQELERNGIFADQIDDNQVVDFLERNPHFFDSHKDLANRLYISHEVQGAEAYSILEWQNKNFRAEIESLKSERDGFFKAFQNNCYTSEQFNLLIQKILKATKISSIESQIKSTLRQSFGYRVSKIYLNHSNFAHHSKTSNKEIKTLKSYLNGDLIYLGAMEKEDIKNLNLGRNNTFILIQLDYKLGFWLVAHPEIQFNKDRENTALLEILSSVLSFKIKQLQNKHQ